MAEASGWYWLQGGEARGPLRREEIEAAFREGRVDASTLVFGPGMAEWLPLGETVTFGHLVAPPEAEAGEEAAPPGTFGEALPAEAPPQIPPPAEPPGSGPPELSARASGPPSAAAGDLTERLRPRPVRRFFARFLDTVLWAVLLELAGRPFGIGWLHPDEAGLFPLLGQAGMLLAEAGCLAKWGATPGKALFGIRVLEMRGLRTLGFRIALARALLVQVLGLGLGLHPALTLGAGIFAWILLTERGITPWDRMLGCAVLSETQTDERRVLAPLVLAGASFLLGALTRPQVERLLEEAEPEPRGGGAIEERRPAAEDPFRPPAPAPPPSPQPR